MYSEIFILLFFYKDNNNVQYIIKKTGHLEIFGDRI